MPPRRLLLLSCNNRHKNDRRSLQPLTCTALGLQKGRGIMLIRRQLRRKGRTRFKVRNRESPAMVGTGTGAIPSRSRASTRLRLALAERQLVPFFRSAWNTMASPVVSSAGQWSI
jgi:hypothetical protein